MQNKPVVLIVSRRLIRKNKPVNWVSEAHMSMLMQQGIRPVFVPIVEETLNFLDDYTGQMDGLLMVEGGDITSPFNSNAAKKEELDEPDALKDRIEISVFNKARELEAPVLGICRGIQIINLMYGGSIANREGGVMHINYDNYDKHRHRVALVKGTPLYDWYGSEKLMVNSYHHMGVQDLAAGFEPMAFDDDGMVEAMHKTDHPFMVGLQFHPERMLPEYAGNIKVFEAFGHAIHHYSNKKQADGNP